MFAVSLTWSLRVRADLPPIFEYVVDLFPEA